MQKTTETDHRNVNEVVSESVGAVLKWLREAREMSIADVNRASGGTISTSYLSTLEKGKIAHPKIGVLHELAHIYGLGQRELLEMVGWIREDAREETGTTKENQLVMAYWADLSDDDRSIAISLLQGLAQRGKNRELK